MTTTIFPAVQPEAVETAAALPMAREVKWNFGRRVPVFRRGEPVLVEGLEAVLAWAWLALQTPRFRHEIYGWGYGCEAESLIGQPYTEALKQAEARRYVSECLGASPYITGVESTVDFADGRLSIACRISTIYGDGEVNANV